MARREGSYDERSENLAFAAGIQAAVDHGPPRPEGSRNAHHRPARKGLVPDETCTEALACEYAAQESHRRPRVSAVEVDVGGSQAIESDAGDKQIGRPRLVDDDPHRAKATRRRDVVLPMREACDSCCAFAERSKQKSTMPDAFVRRNWDAAGKGVGGGMHDYRRHGVRIEGNSLASGGTSRSASCFPLRRAERRSVFTVSPPGYDPSHESSQRPDLVSTSKILASGLPTAT